MNSALFFSDEGDIMAPSYNDVKFALFYRSNVS